MQQSQRHYFQQKGALFLLFCFLLPFWKMSQAAPPIRLEAKGKLIWKNKKRTLVANEDVVVFYNKSTLKTDLLRLFYNRLNGKVSIESLQAEGNVSFRDPQVIATATQATYLPKIWQLRLSRKAHVEGRNLKIHSPKGVLLYIQKHTDASGKEVPPYLQGHGGVQLISNPYTLTAKTVEGFFKKDAQQKYVLTKVKASGHIKVVNEKETLMADQVVYYPNQQKAYLKDRVTIQRGDSFLRGCQAVVDMVKEQSVLKGCKTTKGKVHILLSQ